MARARNIKPAFFQNDMLGDLDPIDRLAFIGMWSVADFKGCIEYRPKMLKVQILPYDTCDIELIVNNLEQARFIRLYSVDGVRYIKVVNFEKHQNPHKNERDAGSTIPDITRSTIINNELDKDVTKPDLIGTKPEPLVLIPDSLLLNPSSLKPKHTAEYSADFESAWESYPMRPGASKKDAFKAWSARLKAGVAASVMIEGAIRYADYCKTQCIEHKYIKQAATFFGSGEHYQSDWTVAITSITNKNRPLTVQESKMDCINQIMGNRYGNDRQTFDIAASRSDSSNGASISKADSEIWEPSSSKVAWLRND